MDNTTYSVNALRSLCLQSVVELVFVRRRNAKDPSSGITRRMICTLNQPLLNSAFGKRLLKFKPPTKTPHYDAASKKLLTVWDIIMQDWRSIPANSCTVVRDKLNLPIIVTSPEGLKKFETYWHHKIAPMQVAKKKEFMDN